MFEIKLSPGAKPGLGGILPGGKVTEGIATIRGIAPGSDAISPNRHPDIRTSSDLLDMIRRVRAVTGEPTGFKVVPGGVGWMDTLLEDINRQGPDSTPDFITVDGAGGGTGAAPMPLIDAVGMPLRESLPLLADRLNQYGPARAGQGGCLGQARHADRCRLGTVYGCRLCRVGARLHVRAGRHPGPAMQPQHLPDRHHHPQQAPAEGARPGGQGHTRCQPRAQHGDEVGTIAHSCGVREPRELRRAHARGVGDNGLSAPPGELHPDVEPPAVVSRPV